VLKIDKDVIGIDSNFFDLGGHSLKATMLMSRIHKVLDIKVPLIEIFKTPTIRAISEHVEAMEWANIKENYYQNSEIEEIII
jgi:acyl carrier protein